MLVYWLGGQLVINGTITLGTLVAMAALVVRIYEPLTALTNARVDIMTAFVSFDRVFEVLDLANPLADRPGAVDLVDPPGPHRVRPRHVPLLRRAPRCRCASLEIGSSGAVDDGPAPRSSTTSAPRIEAGQLVALVGPSGAGQDDARRR